MTADNYCKCLGLDGIAELAFISGESQRALRYWFKKYPIRFDLLARGAALRKIK